MDKFTSQEVNALQKGGNQRARELFINTWDLERERLPNNSNVDKVREFIKNVYVDKKYTLEKSSVRPPRDPQSLRSPEDDTRRSSSYHSYSQSPPYDFQYEERKYGKHAPVLTRKPGSDRGIYEGKLASFLSPTHSSDHGNDGRFSNEGSYSRASDYSVSGGGDIIGAVSPSSHIDGGSPFSETSPDISREVSFNSDANGRSNGGRKLHPQRTTSSGSFGSFDSNSMSFKSANSPSLPESGAEPEQPQQISHLESSSFPSLPHSSVPGTFGGLDLFDTPLAPQNVTSIPSTGSNYQLPDSSLVQKPPVSSFPTFTEQQPSQIFQPSPLDLFAELSQPQSTTSFNGQASDAIMPNDRGWATFDVAQNLVPMVAKNTSSDENVLGKFNPFAIDQSSSYQDHFGQEPSALTHTFAFGNLQSEKTTISDTNFWNAFDDAASGPPLQNVVKNDEKVAENSLGFGVFEALGNDSSVRTSDGCEPLSSLSSHFSVQLNDFLMVPPMDGVQSFATDNKPSNPFDLAFDSDMELTNASQFWDMSSLQAALPNTQTSASYVGGINESWFPQNSVPPYVPGGVSFDPSSGPLGLLVGQAPSIPLP